MMALCPRCKCQFKTLPDEVGDHPCPRCGLSPWDLLLNGREEGEDTGDDDEVEDVK